VSALFTWREAVWADRPSIQKFVCTDPPKDKYVPALRRRVHPRDLEMEVQYGIRGLEPPYTGNKQMLVGEKDGAIGAVFLFEDADDPGNVFLSAIAVAWHLRSSREARDGRYGQEALQVTLCRIRRRAFAAGFERVFVTGKIHNKNRASQRLCRSAGLEPLTPVANDLTLWHGTFDALSN